jgi:hypothetical protein
MVERERERKRERERERVWVCVCDVFLFGPELLKGVAWHGKTRHDMVAWWHNALYSTWLWIYIYSMHTNVQAWWALLV